MKICLSACSQYCKNRAIFLCHSRSETDFFKNNNNKKSLVIVCASTSMWHGHSTNIQHKICISYYRDKCMVWFLSTKDLLPSMSICLSTPPPKKYFLWPPSLSNYSSTCFLFSVTLLCSLSLLSDQLLLYNLSVRFPSHFPAIIHQISAIVKSMKFSILCLHFLSETYLFANYPLAAENPLSVSLQATETCILLRVMLQ